MEIRSASPEDAIAIEAVHFASRDAVYRGRIPDWPNLVSIRDERVARWADWLRRPEILTLVSEVGDEIVGFVTLRASADVGEDPTRVGEMPTLYVHPSHWRRGHGSALCNSALTKARDLGFEELTLWVVDLNVGARRFYTAYGFAEDGRTTVDEGASEQITVTARRFRISLDGRWGPVRNRPS
jgi:ribosomal protein S18 acetylase RimI-like enzyme